MKYGFESNEFLKGLKEYPEKKSGGPGVAAGSGKNEVSKEKKDPWRIFGVGIIIFFVLTMFFLFLSSDFWKWSMAKRADTLVAYRNYKADFPSGAHVKDAENRIAAFAAAAFEKLPKPYSEKNIAAYLRKFKEFPVADVKRRVVNDMLLKNDLDYYTAYDRMFCDDDEFKSTIDAKIRERESELWAECSVSEDRDFLAALCKGVRTKDIADRFRERIRILDEKAELELWEKRYENSRDIRGLEKLVADKVFSSDVVLKRLRARVEELYGDFDAVAAKGTKEAYEKFLEKKPDSPMADAARRKIVDLEVSEIAKSEHGAFSMSDPLPNFSGERFELATIELENQTSHVITVRYSGPESVKVAIPPFGKKTITVPAGNYKIAVTTVQPRVRPFYGENNVSGGKYSERFYISTY